MNLAVNSDDNMMNGYNDPNDDGGKKDILLILSVAMALITVVTIVQHFIERTKESGF